MRAFLVLLALVAACFATPSQVFAMPAEGISPINSREYAPAVRVLMQKAQKRIYLMLYQTRFYTEYPDTITNRYVDDLIEARKRGLDVRVVIDTGEWNERGKNEYNVDYVDRLTTAGVQVWEDSPEEVSHQKVILIDDDISVVSSHNWSFYSVAQNNEVAVIVYSRPLNEWFGKYFEQRVSGGKKHPVFTTGTVEITHTVSADGTTTRPELPFKKYPVVDVEPIANRDYYPAVHDAILSATKSVDVVQRQFVIDSTRPFAGGKVLLPGEPISSVNILADDLIAAAKRGLKVRVVIDQTEGMESPQNDQSALYLQQHGVEVFRESLDQQTHAKLLVIDDDKAIVGSTNWTYPALELGNEVSVLIKSTDINKVYREYVEKLLQSGASYRPASKSIWDTPVPAQQGAQ